MAVFWGSPEVRVHMGTSAVMDDTVDYTDSNDWVHVDLAGALERGSGQPPIFGGYADGDQFVSIENVWGSVFNDRLAGDGVANGLFGYGGNDRITGGAGHDTLRGEAGGDTVSGGPGNDWVYGDEGLDLVSGNTGNDAVLGGLGNDTVHGDEGEDVLWGGKGDDLLIGGATQADTLENKEPDAHADTLEGGLGADTLYGDTARTDAAGMIIGPGPDVTPNDVRDVAAYTLSNAGVVVNLSAARMVSDGTASGVTPMLTLTSLAGGHAAGDVLYGITHVRGSAHADTLTGGGTANWLWGNAGKDLVAGSGGNDVLFGGRGDDTVNGDGNDDTLEGGAGADRLDGGAGNDVVSYAGSPEGVQVNLSNAMGHTGGHAVGDTLMGFEQVTGSAHTDLLIGTGGRETMRGGAGDDWDNPMTALSTPWDGLGLRTEAARGGLFGGGQFDRIYGGDGNDLLVGEGHQDFLFGEAGNDYLHGGDINDELQGGPGNDTLVGGAGSDRIFGHDGDDLIVWDSVDRGRDGGPGNDTLTVTPTSGAVTLDINDNGASNNQNMLGMENIIGGRGNDTLRGNQRANVLEGRDGNDTLEGRDGNDTLIGGLGSNTLNGGNGIDRYVLARQPADTGSGTRIAQTITRLDANEKIDISAFGLTQAQLADVLRSQGTGNIRTVDFGAGKGQVMVTLGTGLTELTADDFLL